MNKKGFSFINTLWYGYNTEKIMTFIQSLKFSSGRILKKIYFKISIDKNIDIRLNVFPLIYKI